ncbi:MAG: efflux RND transporter periplasmic adaptor subunit [Acidobacteriota bacterium]|nr:efflux RND transporter periplasmic adaptor subunit [Acidobacteriota bacterium]MDQ7086478.1 efflux RND transporter periplasmic adaptor subunit [Acidobacteriota bacterium]
MTAKPTASAAPLFLLLLLLLAFLAACSGEAPAASTGDGHDPVAGDEHHDTPGEDHEAEAHDEHQPGIVELSPRLLARAEIRTATAQRRHLPAEIRTTGQVDFNRDRLVHVTPRIAGRIVEARADLGDRVRPGEVLAVMDSIELGQAKSDYLQARARRELALQNYEREESLRAERISSEREVLDAQAALREATAVLRAAEERLHLLGLDQDALAAVHYDDPQSSLYEVRAPIAGKVVRKHISLGEMASTDSVLFTIADLSSVWIWIDVYERNLQHVHLEDDIRVRADAYPDRIFIGEVTYLSDEVDTDTRTVRARIDVKNADGALRPGMFVRVQISDPHLAPAQSAGMVVVPEDAVQRNGDEYLVFVSLGEGRFMAREVEPGRKASGFVEIRQGIEAGEEVVIQGSFTLKSELSKESLGGGHAH